MDKNGWRMMTYGSTRQGKPGAPYCGSNIAVHDVHADQVQETEGNQKKLKTKEELRNR